MGLERVNVTGEPVNATHTVRGSEPSCSVLPPFAETTGPGKVAGISVSQVFPEAVTVTPSIVVFVELYIYMRPGEQLSRAIRAAKEAAI